MHNCGKTGKELDELYLPLSGLDREEIRVCNTVLCWADSNKTPTEKEIRACAAHHLREEIERTNPDMILLLGSTPCSLVPGIRLDLHHGIAQHTRKVGDLMGWEGWLVPMYHPAIGLHESRWMQICMEDWQGLAADMAVGFDDDPELEPIHYSKDLHGCWLSKVKWVSVDTESHGGRAWSVQWSQRAREGWLTSANDAEAIALLRALLPNIEVILHNAAYDLEVLRKLGIHVRSYRDTMQEAFHLGDLPQGLKPLVYRLFRHTITSYEETVRPASIRALYDWMTEAFKIAQLDLCYTERVQLKTKVKEVVRKGELESLLTRLLRLTDARSEYDPWERLDAFWGDPLNEWMRDHVETRIGPYPILGIANCSEQEAIRYAVGDADWTGRVAVELARRRAGAFQIFEGDRDV